MNRPFSEDSNLLASKRKRSSYSELTMEYMAFLETMTDHPEGSFIATIYGRDLWVTYYTLKYLLRGENRNRIHVMTGIDENFHDMIDNVINDKETFLDLFKKNIPVEEIPILTSFAQYFDPHKYDISIFKDKELIAIGTDLKNIKENDILLVSDFVVPMKSRNEHMLMRKRFEQLITMARHLKVCIIIQAPYNHDHRKNAFSHIDIFKPPIANFKTSYVKGFLNEPFLTTLRTMERGKALILSSHKYFHGAGYLDVRKFI